MNSIVLMAEIVSDPEKRMTPDGQSTVASFTVEFPNPKPTDAPFRLRVTGWNRLADEIMDSYHRGDQVVVEGRLRMESVDRGAYKEKVAEITAQRIHALSGTATQAAPQTDTYAANYPSSAPSRSWSDDNYQRTAAGVNVPRANAPVVSPSPSNSQVNTSFSAPYADPLYSGSQAADPGINDDDIPF